MSKCQAGFQEKWETGNESDWQCVETSHLMMFLQIVRPKIIIAARLCPCNQ